MESARRPALRFLANPYFLLALAALTWSGNHVVGRAIAGEVPPYALSTLRWAIPVPVLWLFARPHLARDWPTIRRHWPILAFLGVGGGAIFSALQYVGLQYTTALNVSVLNSLAPVMIAGAAAILFREALTMRQGLGIVISLAGVLVIVSKGDPAMLAALSFNVGDVVILFNMTIWAVYSACLRLSPRIHWLSFAFVLAAISAVATLPAMIWEHASGYTLKPNMETVLAVAYVAVFPSVVGYAAWNRGVAAIGSNRAGVFLYVIPLYSAVLATVFLGEHLMAFHVVGFAGIVAGVMLASRRA
jgi:drug/metabolite transporter (DMT)-like permease